MSTDFKWFKAENTGKVEKYPARFEGRPGLTPVDEGGCTDCGYETVEQDVDTQEITPVDWSYVEDTVQEDEDN